MLLLLCQSAFAWPPTFGSEFNFTSPAIELAWKKRVTSINPLEGQAPNRVEQAAAKQFAETVKKMCGEKCKIIEHPGKFDTEFKIVFEDGWEFNVSTDPAVVEIQTQPATALQIEKQLPKYERYIFTAAREAGLGGKTINLKQEGSAHLNIGVRSAFEDQPAAFARYLADYSNRPALAMGVFGEDLHNAPTMILLKGKQQKKFQLLLENVNKGKIKTIEGISNYMNAEVYTSNPDFMFSGANARHYQAVGLKQLITEQFETVDMPFELRAIRQPKTAYEYKLITQLMDKRIAYLKGIKNDPIYYRANTALNTPKFSSLEKAAHFQIYLEEMGEDWKTYKKLVPSEVLAPLEKGDVERILTGNINWTSNAEVQVFRKVMVNNVHLSPWMREKVWLILSQKRIPEAELTQIFHDLLAQIDESPLHAQVIQKFLTELRNKGIFSDMPPLTVKKTTLVKNCFLKVLKSFVR